MDKYDKLSTKVNPDWISYYRHGKTVSMSFTVHIVNSEIENVDDMKRMNGDGFYVNDKAGNCTKEEFDEMLDKAIEFLKK